MKTPNVARLTALKIQGKSTSCAFCRYLHGEVARITPGGNEILRLRCSLDMNTNLPAPVSITLPSRNFLESMNWEPIKDKRCSKFEAFYGFGEHDE